ncbi:unnamed protein product, partial [Rangifer tarandus platyrhynchus]
MEESMELQRVRHDRVTSLLLDSCKQNLISLHYTSSPFHLLTPCSDKTFLYHLV